MKAALPGQLDHRREVCHTNPQQRQHALVRLVRTRASVFPGVVVMRPSRGDGLLTTAEAARLVGVSPATIRSWRSARRGWLTVQGLDERGWPLHTREAVREAERLVREHGLSTSGIDPRTQRLVLRAA